MRRNVLLGAVLVWAALGLKPALAGTESAYMHYLKAVLLQHQGDYPGALKEYQAAAALDPQSDFILEQAVELALETGQSSDAFEMAKRLMKIDPKNPKVWVLLGNVYWARGDVPEAQKSFEAALKLDSKYADAMFALGGLLNAQSPEKARRYFEQYLEANPDRAAEAHFQIALVDERLSQIPQAVDELKAAEEIEPDFLQARYALAHIYEVRHDTDAALGEYLGIVDREADNAPLLNHIGELYYNEGDAAMAATYFRRAKTASPQNPDACLWLAILAEQRGDFNAAVAELSQSSAIKKEPELALRLSYYLTQANRLKEAVQALEDAYKKWPDNNEIAYFLALGYDDLKNSDKAIALLREILGRAPDSRDARFQLATLYEKFNKIDDMEREFRALLQERPSDATALNYLGYSLADRGLKLPEAEEFIRRAVALDPMNGAYRDSLGWVEFKLGRSTQALEELQTAVRFDTEEADVWEHLGEVQQAVGDSSGAWTSWKTGLAYDPANEKLSKDVAAVEFSMAPEALGSRLLEYLGRTHGSIQRLGTVCEIKGTVADKALEYRGLIAFDAPAKLRLELLGPMFVPVFRAELDASGTFSMDSLPLDGVPPEATQQFVRQILALLRDYFAGRVFEERPAEYHKGWRTHWIGTLTRQLFLDDANQHLQGLKTSAAPPLRLSLDDFRSEHGHAVPMFLQLDGRGFSVSLRFVNPTVAYRAVIGALP